MRSSLQLVLWLAGLVTASVAYCQEPILVIDAGGHSSAVRSLIFTGRFLISAGEDKVARVWDSETGKVVQVIRGQIASGQGGKIYATALSADSRMLAVGGWLAGESRESAAAIRIHDFPGGQVSGLLKGLHNNPLSIGFSPDGRLVAAGDADGTICVWNLGAKGKCRELKAHTAAVQTVQFSKDSTRLLSGGRDRTIRLWDVAQGRVISVLTGHQGVVISATFSADNRYIASVSDDKTIRLWDGTTGALLKILDDQEDRPANLVISPDGSKILVSYASDGKYIAQILSVPDGRVVARFRNHDSLIHAVALSANGRLAASAGGTSGEIFLWDAATGALVKKLASQGKAVMGVGYARDGRSVAFGASRYAQPRINAAGPLEQVLWLNQNGAYHVALDGEVKNESDYRGAEDHLADMSLSLPDQFTLRLEKAGQVLREVKRDQTSGFRHLAYTFTPDGRYIISGGQNGVLTRYTADRNMSEMNLAGHTGHVFAVAVSADGKTLISGSEDETFRLWDVASGKCLLTVFVTVGREWVAWTPEGYYGSSPEGDRYVGWQVNQGEGKEARYFTVAQCQKEFYRPDVIGENLRVRDLRTALRTANANRGKPANAVPTEVSTILPPSVYVLSPDRPESTWDSDTLHLKAAAISATLPITEVKVLLNGALAQVMRGKAQKQDVDLDLKLQPGVNTVRVIASNGSSTAESTVSKITFVPVAGTVELKRPSLYVLAIGISGYSQQSMKLDYGDKDAQEIDRIFRQQAGGRLFNQVQTRLLTNQEADRKGVFKGLEWLSKSGNERDVRVVFLSGHGILSSQKSYFYCPYDFSLDGPPAAFAVGWSDILDLLTATPGKAVLIVDTCHAAAISGKDKTKGLTSVDFTEVLKEFNQYPGLVTLAASRGNESSIERAEWGHGAFTQALIEALTGKINRPDGVIRTSDLGRWLEDRVPGLTGQSQHPIYAPQPRDMEPFPLFDLRQR